MNKPLCAVLLVLAAVSGLSPPARAQSPAPGSPHAYTGNLGLVSEYRYRGIAQTDGRPALQGGFDYAHAGGLYLGTWASNVSWLSDGGGGAVSNSLEWDFYGGYKRAIGDFAYDAGLLHYDYPGSYPSGYTSPDTTELYVAGSWKRLTLKYSYGLSNLFGAVDSKGAGYLDLTGNFEVGGGFTLVAHVGHQAVPAGSANGVQVRSSGDCSYTDWKLGVTREMLGLGWGFAWIDTNAKADTGQCYRSALGRDLGKGTAVLSVSKTF